MLQTQALDILKMGTNIFLTGEPGSGKTHTINEYVKYLRTRGIEPAVTAATGIAATHLGGLTIHSWSGIGIKEKLDRRTLAEIAGSNYVSRRINKTQVLIIDEVSMLSANTLDMVDMVCRRVRQNELPFGGLQVILVGDFFQLPPIIKKTENEAQQTTLIAGNQSHFAYDSSAWTRANFNICYLTEQYRQDDAVFLDMLSAIRHNNFNEEYLQHFETRRIEHHESPTGVTKLFSHNIDVNNVNEMMLAKLSEEVRTFNMMSDGRQKLVETLKKGCLSPETLRLKVGAVVMFTKNNPRAKFMNGTLGRVLDFNQESNYPIVRTRAGVIIEVEPMEWQVEEDGKIRAQITQIPLRLAWAITVHKSQGMSLDAAVMDLSSVFEFGQGYVALSRVRRLSGLYLLGWNERVFQVHPEVLKKDESFNANSATVLEEFNKLSPEEIVKKQNDFIKACGGQNVSTGEQPAIIGKKYNVKTIRETFANAYRPWDKEQDEKLLEWSGQKLKVKDIAGRMGRKTGAIRSRLIKLGVVKN